MKARIEQLRERFIRCNSPGMVESACVQGGLILKSAFDSGESFGFEDLSKLLQTEFFQMDHDSFLNEFKLSSAFKLFASQTSEDPNILASKIVSRSNGVVLSTTKPNSYQEQSERYAAFCDEMIEALGVEGDQRDDDGLHQKALDQWNAGATWSEVLKNSGDKESTVKAFMQAVKRYAERNSKSIREGSPGTKPNRNK